MKNNFVALLISILLLLTVGGVVALILLPESTPVIPEKIAIGKSYTLIDRPPLVLPESNHFLQATTTKRAPPYKLIVRSLEGREIQAWEFGKGDTTLLFVGGIHGGYEWNTVLLAYELIDYLSAYGEYVPKDMRILIIPTLNPDGLFRVVGTSERFGVGDAPQFVHASEVLPTEVVVSGRFNARGVDLNRNFDCKWQKSAVWRNYTVSAGTKAFSEPESAGLRDFILSENPVAVIFYQSGSDGLFSSACNADPLTKTKDLLTIYSEASGYTAYQDYSYYSITGDATDWLASVGIPAFTVELRTHNELEWEQNKRGFDALVRDYSNEW